MAVVENVGFNIDNSLNRTQSLLQSDIDHSKSNGAGNLTLRSGERNNLHTDVTIQLEQQQKMSNGTAAEQMSSVKQHNHLMKGDGVVQSNQVEGVDSRRNGGDNGDGEEAFKQEMRDLEEMLSKLNPMAEEFVPPSFVNYTPFVQNSAPAASQFGYFPDTKFLVLPDSPVPGGNSGRRKKIGYSHGKRRMNSRTSMAQSEEVIRRTVYVSDIDHQVTEEQLAALFNSCGQVVDCRICGDPNSVLRFAFVEFTDEDGARNALSLAGTMLGFYPVKVLPSKTAIAPVNPTFLPRSEDEREMSARTIYCTNIDKKVTQADVKLFFESVCGKVFRLRLLGDYHHSTRIAFVEFVDADSAIAALNCSGVILGSLPIRVSPSKTPVRQRGPRAAMHRVQLAVLN